MARNAGAQGGGQDEDRRSESRGNGPLRSVGCIGGLRYGTRAAVSAVDEYYEHGLSGDSVDSDAEARSYRRSGTVGVWGIKVGQVWRAVQVGADTL